MLSTKIFLFLESFIVQIIQGFTERLKRLIAEKFNGKPGRLARLAGISPGTFQRYIDGESIPGGETLLKIKEVSDISIDWLLTGKESWVESAAEASSPYGLSEEERNLLRLYRGADEVTRKYAKEMLEVHQEKGKKKSGA